MIILDCYCTLNVSLALRSCVCIFLYIIVVYYYCSVIVHDSKVTMHADAEGTRLAYASNNIDDTTQKVFDEV